MTFRPLPTSSFLLAALLIPASAQAQAAQRLQDELDFVRSVATKLRFIHLAQEEVEALKKERTKSDEFKLISQLGIEISLIGAKVRPNREERRTLYKDAVDRSAEMIERYDGEPVALAARRTLVDACYEFGQFLIEELEIARAENPDKLPELEEEAAAIFRKGVEAAEKVMRELEDKRKSDRRADLDYALTWLTKGKLLREHARAVKNDRVYLGELSKTTLEDMVFEYDEGTAIGMRAMFERVQAIEVLGENEEALLSYEDVVRNAMKALTSEELNLSGDVREIMVIMMEEAYDHLVNLLFELGRGSEVLEKVAEYRKNLESLGVPLTVLGGTDKKGNPIEPVLGSEDERFGHSVYLSEARAMFESGKPELSAKALEIAKFFNERHPADIIGLKAKKLISNILETGPAQVSVDLLLEVAKGEYQNQNYEAAIKRFRRALGAMDAQVLRDKGIQAWLPIANSYARTDRFLEAVMALKTGLEASPPKSPETEDAADVIVRAMRNVRLNSQQDPFFDRLNDEVTALAAKYGSAASEAKLRWQEGQTALQEKDYAKAATAFAEVPESAPQYELARVRGAFAQLMGGNVAAFQKSLEEYRTWLKGDGASLPAERPDLAQARESALAEAAYFEGLAAFMQASGAPQAGGKKDPTKWPEVVRLFADFPDRHGKSAPKQAESSYYYRGLAHVNLGELDKAEAMYRTLRKLSPKSEQVPALATAIFGTYHENIKAKGLEVEAARDAKDDKRADAALDQLNSLRKAALNCGLDYEKYSDEPQFGVVFNTLDYAFALNDWTTVQSLGERMIELFAKSSDPQAVAGLDKLVKPLLGEALLRAGKYQQAHQMLTAAEKANPQDYPLKRLVCLALGGWKEIDERGQFREYPGLGKPGEAWMKYNEEYKAYGLHSTRAPDYSLAWYQFQWESYYFALKAALGGDSEFARRAKSIYSIARSIDEFGALKAHGPDGRRLFDLFEGNPPPR